MQDDGLDELEHEVITKLLTAWIGVYDKAEAVYQAYDDETRQWVNEQGHRVESLVTVVATMQPDVRVLCRSLVEDGLAAHLDRLSHPADTVEHAVEQTIARAKSGGEKMGGVEDRVSLLEDRVTEIEEWNSQLADVLRRRTEELREAGGRLESAERRLSKLLDRHEELERYAAQHLGRDVDDLRKAVRGIGIVASALEPRPIQVDQ